MRRYLFSSLLWLGLLMAVLSSCALKSGNTPPAVSTLESTPILSPTSTPESITLSNTASPTQVPSPTATIDPYPDIEAIDQSNTYWLDTLARFGVGHIFDVALSPDQSLFAVYTGSGIYLYDRATFAEVNYVPIESYAFESYASVNGGSIEDIIRFMPNGRQLLFSIGSNLMIWDFNTNENPKSFQTDVEMSGWQTTQIEFTFDGNYMLQTTNGARSSGAWKPNGLHCEGKTFNIAIFDLTMLTKTHDRYECQLSVPDYRITENGYIQFFTGSWMLPRSYPNYPMKTVVVDPQTGAEIASAKKIHGDTPFDVLRVETSGDRSLLPTEEEFLLWEDEQRWGEIPQLFVFDPLCGIQEYVGGGYQVLYTDEQTFILAYGDWRPTYKIEQWNRTTCTIENSLSYQDAQSVEFSPTGSMFVITNGKGLEVWDLKTQTILFTIQAKRVGTPISFFRFSEDESKLFTGSRGHSNTTSSLASSNSPQAIEIWDTATGEKMGELQPTEHHFSGIELTHNPEIVLTFDEKGTTLWNIKTKSPINPANSPFPRIYAVDPLRDGVWFARSEDRYSYELFLVDVTTGEIKREMSPRNGDIYRVNATLGSPALYLFERQRIINVLDVESEQVLWQEKINHSGYHRTTSQGELYATDYAPGWTQLFSTLNDVSSPKFVGEFVTTSQSLLITEFGGDYLIWDKTNAGFIDKISSYYDIADIAISPDSHFIVIVTSNGQIEIMGIN